MKTTTNDVRVTCAQCNWLGGFDEATNAHSGLMRCPSCGDRNVRRADPSEERCAEFDALAPQLVALLDRAAVNLALEAHRHEIKNKQRMTILRRIAHESQAAAFRLRQLMRS